MKHVQSFLSTREDQESSFHRCGGPMRLVQACLCAGKELITTFQPPRRCSEARAGLLKCQRKSRRQF